MTTLLFDSSIEPDEQGIKFPICFCDEDTQEYYCFNEGSHVTRVRLDLVSITKDNHIFLTMSEDQFKRWILHGFGSKPSRRLISLNEFKTALYAVIDHICFTLGNKHPFLNNEQLNHFKQLLNQKI